MMNEHFLTLNKLVADLKCAFQDKDWEKVAELDLTSQSVINDNASLVKTSNDKILFTALISELQSLYDLLVSENIDRRTEFGLELKKLNKEHNAISQYLKSSGY
jgi:hypothetical protein